MVIKSVHLKNFKCFEDVELTLPKITILTGPNSSGKSSLMYGILSALQSGGFPVRLSPNGDFVEMGDFIEFVFGHNKNNEIEIDLNVGDEKNKVSSVFNTSWVYDQISKMPLLNKLYVCTDFIEIRIEKRQKYHISFKVDRDKFSKSVEQKALIDTFKFIGLFEETFSKEEKENLKKQGILEDFNKLEPQDFDISNIDEFTFSNLTEKSEAIAFLTTLAFNRFAVEKNLINYICSFRIQPDRTYYQKVMTGDKVGKFGEKYVDQILEWRDKRTEEFKELTRILRELDLLYWLTIRRLRGGRYEPRVAVHQGGPWSSLLDIGFGISQFLPILVADLQLGKNSTLFVAQPEIHLHPSVQALVAEYFVNNVKEKNKRYVIETHSEYLLNRIRSLIVKDKINTQDIAIYYFENTTKGSIKYEIQFTKNGQILNAPKGFFDTYMMDVMDIALNSEKE